MRTKLIDLQPEKPKTTDSATGLNTTIYEGIFAKAQAEREKFKTEEYPRLVKKYGVELTENEAAELYKAEQKIAGCENCQGLPCKRENLVRPFISQEETYDGTIRPVIRYGLCNYKRAENKKARLDKKFKAAKIPPQYRGKNFSDYEVNADNAAAVKAAKNFLKDGTGGLFFFGNPGTGKTFLASIVTQEFLKSNKSVIFGDVPSLLEILRSSFDDKNTKITDLMDDLAAVDLLVLDDLGTEKPTMWAVERIYTIVNRRYNAEKPVIVTSNFRLKEIGERLNHPKDADGIYPSVTGDRIISRLAQMCSRVEFKGKDRRL